MSVTKVIILYSKDLVVSHVCSYIPYSKELVVSMFLDTFVVKGIGRFHVYRYFPNSKVSGNSKTTKSLEVFKEFGQISCFWTLSVFKSVQKE